MVAILNHKLKYIKICRTFYEYETLYGKLEQAYLEPCENSMTKLFLQK